MSAQVHLQFQFVLMECYLINLNDIFTIALRTAKPIQYLVELKLLVHLVCLFLMCVYTCLRPCVHLYILAVPKIVSSSPIENHAQF
jgi:hypothetical protein